MARNITTGCPIIHIHDVTKVEYDADPTVFEPQGGPGSGFTTRHIRIYDKSGHCVMDLNLFSRNEDSGSNTLPEQWIEADSDA